MSVGLSCGHLSSGVCGKCATPNLDQLKAQRDEAIKKLGDALVVLWQAEKDRDEARRDFVRVAEVLGMVSTDDTGRIGAVATVGEVVAHAKEAAAALSKWEEVQESLLMACEEPRTNCECPGCSYAREKDGAHT